MLDGAVDPDTRPEEPTPRRSAKAFEAGFDAFAANCVAPDRRLPDRRRTRGSSSTDLLDPGRGRRPIPSSEPGETRQATAGRRHDGRAGRRCTTPRPGRSWPRRWPRRRRATPTGLFSLADSYSGRLDDGTYSNLFDANLAVNCADTDEKYTESEIRTLAADWNRSTRCSAPARPLGLYTCSVWKAHRTPLPERDAAGSAPILVVGNTGDPVTPLPGAQDMAEDLDERRPADLAGPGAHRLPARPTASPRRWTPT